MQGNEPLDVRCMSGSGREVPVQAEAGQSVCRSVGLLALSDFAISTNSAGDAIPLGSPPGKASFARRFYDIFVTRLASS
jgi:hypothetical protein